MNHLLRILDANANRAREGLRVMEDLARFAIDRADLCERCKAVRHQIAEAVAVAAPDLVGLLASRATESDVGTTIGTTREYTRRDLSDLSRAAASRAQEALRSLEETAKALAAPTAARSFESVRYAVYTLERDLILSLPSGTAPQWKLCVVVTESLCTHHPWKRIIEDSIAGGADCIQLREKQLTDRELLSRAREVANLCRAAHVACVINDRVDIALASGASGVHLGPDDVSITDARTILGRSRLIGLSASTLDAARAAMRYGADYIGIGAMFPTTTKHKDAIAGPDLLREILTDDGLSRLPHLAIGGINTTNTDRLREAGCRGVAVSSAVCGASSPRDVCRAILEHLAGVPTASSH